MWLARLGIVISLEERMRLLGFYASSLTVQLRRGDCYAATPAVEFGDHVSFCLLGSQEHLRNVAQVFGFDLIITHALLKKHEGLIQRSIVVIVGWA